MCKGLACLPPPRIEQALVVVPSHWGDDGELGVCEISRSCLGDAPPVREAVSPQAVVEGKAVELREQDGNNATGEFACGRGDGNVLRSWAGVAAKRLPNEQTRTPGLEGSDDRSEKKNKGKRTGRNDASGPDPGPGLPVMASPHEGLCGSLISPAREGLQRFLVAGTRPRNA